MRIFFTPKESEFIFLTTQFFPMTMKNEFTFYSNVINDDILLRQKMDPSGSEKRRIQMWRSMLVGDCKRSIITDK